MRLIAEGLAGERGGERIYDGASFVIEAGRALVISGPNGAGKSTLLRGLAGLLPLAAGRLVLEGGGADFTDTASACHYLGPHNAMKAALTVTENLKFWQRWMGKPLHSPDEALAMTGLEGAGRLPFGYLSTGQKRRAAIARLLVSFRPVWLLDEPTSGLDAASETRFAGLMTDHLAKGGLIAAATHLPLGLGAAQNLAMTAQGGAGS